MVINKYKFKDGTSVNDLIADGFSYSLDTKYLTKFITLKSSIVLYLKIRLIDFELLIDVLDDDYCQPYCPFYDYMDGEIDIFPFLEKIIKTYNVEMDKLKSFEVEKNYNCILVHGDECINNNDCNKCNYSELV